MEGNLWLYRLYFRVVILLWLPVSLSAVDLPNLTFRTITISDGLSNNIINTIYKDKRGFIWLGTQTGLDRFDGINMKSFLQFSGRTIFSIAETDSVYLWVGTDKGLWKLDRKTDQVESVTLDTKSLEVRSVFVSQTGRLLVGTTHGLFIYQESAFRKVLFGSNALSSINFITGIVEGYKDTFWLTSQGGLIEYNIETGQSKVYTYQDDEKFVSYFSCLALLKEKLYLGTAGSGMLVFDIGKAAFSICPEVENGYIKSIITVNDEIWVGTNGSGIRIISASTGKELSAIEHTSNADAICSNAVYSLLKEDDMLWVGTYMGGLSYTPAHGSFFSVYSYPELFNSYNMNVRAFWVDADGKKVIGTRDGLFYIDEENHRYKSFKVPQLRSNMIFSCLYYQNEYYIGTYGGGMYVLNPATLTLRDFEPDGGMPFSKGHIFCIKQDREKNLWIGTSLGIFCYKDGRQIAHYTSANSKLPEGNVYEIYFDSTHKGWICTENGMCIWDPSARTLKTDVFPEGFIHKEKIRVIYEDSNHDLYFFPDKGSLFISDLSMTIFRRLQPGTPLDGNDGMFIVEDREKWLWLGTNNGLFRYDKKDHFIPYNFVDGIPSSIFTLCPPVRDENGIWFGNSKGLLYLDTVRMNQRKSVPYSVAITDICVNGKSVVQSVVGDGGKSEISLEASQKNVTFYFSDFSYTAPAFMSYEYQLEGEDTGWMALTGRSDITYYDLPSGNYTFKVRQMGNPESETQLTVKIASSISIWSIVFIVIAVVTGSIAVLYQKKKEVENEREELMPDSAKVIEKEIQPVEESHIVAEEKYRTNKISVEECKRLAEKLEIVMHREKPYTNPNLKIADLAVSIGTSSHTLSYLFNQYLNRNYYDYINDYRIAEFKRLVEKDEYAKYTLSALAELCGFSSRASFFRYFKKATNITPNEYIRSIGKNNE